MDDYYAPEPDEPNALAIDPAKHNALIGGSARFAARKAELAAAKEAVAATYALVRDAPLGELARRNDELVAADAAYKRLLREDQ